MRKEVNQLKQLAKKFDDKLDDGNKQYIKGGIISRIKQIKHTPIQQKEQIPKKQEHFSYKTAKLEVNRPELTTPINHKEAGSFSKPSKHDLKQDAEMQILKEKEGMHPTNVEFKNLKEKIQQLMKPITPALPKEMTLRIKTGIPGFDKLTIGGFEKDSVNMIAGTAGAGKSIFCMQFIINGITMYNEPGIYITFEESKKRFYKHMLRFGWDLEKLEEQGMFMLLQYTPTQIKKTLEEGGGSIEAAIRKMKAKRLVIDSLTAFTLLYETEFESREAVLNLFSLLSRLNMTILVTAEQEYDPDKHTATMLEFEVDSIVLLYYLRRGNTRTRAIEVYKMRGSNHTKGIFPMYITNKGIRVFPEEVVF